MVDKIYLALMVPVKWLEIKIDNNFSCKNKSENSKNSLQFDANFLNFVYFLDLCSYKIMFLPVLSFLKNGSILLSYHTF